MSAVPENGVLGYVDGLEHLSDELRHLDQLIRQRVVRLRAENAPAHGDPGGAGVYVSDAEVDGLLQPSQAAAAEEEQIRRERLRCLETIRFRIKAGVENGAALPLLALAQVFRLTAFETQALLICLAPELDRKYDRLYAYLQDDIARKKPSVDLVLDLLCDDAPGKWRARALLSGHSPLFRAGLIKTVEDAHSPSGSSGLARLLKVDERVVHYLLGQVAPDPRLLDAVEWLGPAGSGDEPVLDPRLLAEALAATERHLSETSPAAAKLLWNFHGPRGAGKRTLAHWICRRIQCPLISVDVEMLLNGAGEDENPFLPIFREGLLLQAAVYLHSAEALTRDDARAGTLAKQLAATVSQFGWVTFLGTGEPWPRRHLFQSLLFRSMSLPAPGRGLRQIAWERALRLGWPESEEAARLGLATHLADHFRLSPGRIHRAAADLLRSEPGALPTAERFCAACREQGGRLLGEFAVRIEPRHRWEDLVLATEKIRHLREICDHLRHSHEVFAQWGFEDKISYGRGLSVLFCGPPGTGKTLAAQVIARELGMELYKIDLSGVVSKYIGETEKNLQRIFTEAGGGGAILFFDEADALFGKRTEVSDAHDRYANIETSFLLQKMEEYEGMVILASNLRDNMDEAFVRRIRFIVEFNFPEAADREAIWKAHFPGRAPLGPDVDCALLARNFPVTGGNIKNIVLNGAFLAAGNGGTIGMQHLLQGAKREYEKIGKLWTDRTNAAKAGPARPRPDTERRS